MVFFRRSEAQRQPTNLTIELSGSPRLNRSTWLLHTAFNRAIKGKSRLSEAVLGMPGMSGRRYRMFINNLAHQVPNARYLEVGTWAGSTACAAMEGNKLAMLCIDDWSQFGGPRDAFLKHIDMFRNEAVQFDFVESDFREVGARKIGRFTSTYSLVSRTNTTACPHSRLPWRMTSSSSLTTGIGPVLRHAERHSRYWVRRGLCDPAAHELRQYKPVYAQRRQ